MRRERKYQITFGLFVLSGVGMVYWLEEDIPFFLCWFGAIVFSFSSYQYRQILCPHCRKTIHQYWQHFLHCPYCGQALEEPQKSCKERND
ncbi:MAG: hypothetical protein ACOX7N_05430 [Lawsonibacter sp.]|jgi:hypothetical protein